MRELCRRRGIEDHLINLEVDKVRKKRAEHLGLIGSNVNSLVPDSSHRPSPPPARRRCNGYRERADREDRAGFWNLRERMTKSVKTTVTRSTVAADKFLHRNFEMSSIGEK